MCAIIRLYAMGLTSPVMTILFAVEGDKPNSDKHSAFLFRVNRKNNVLYVLELPN